MKFLYAAVCEHFSVYTHTHTYIYIYIYIYMVYSFVFAMFPSVKTFVSRLEQTPSNVSEQRGIC